MHSTQQSLHRFPLQIDISIISIISAKSGTELKNNQLNVARTSKVLILLWPYGLLVLYGEI